MTKTEHRHRMEELQQKFRELHAEAYDKDPSLAQQRGRDFERLILEVFELHGMKMRGPYHTRDNKSEQIDGALTIDGRYALLEVKWENANLAASDLFAFLGKVEGKFVGTIGIFVSRKELTPNFLT